MSNQWMDNSAGVLQLRHHVGWTTIALAALPPAGAISSWDGSTSWLGGLGCHPL